jgi:hypothetical protein
MTRKLLGVAVDDARPVYQAVGCARCDNMGYRGRAALMELFKLDAEIDELIARRATAREVRLAAAAKGFRTLADDAIARVLLGQTSLEEISRGGRPHRPRDLRRAMALFAYRAVDADGRHLHRQPRRRQRDRPGAAAEAPGPGPLTFEGVKRSTAARTRNVTRTELITFCFHLSQLLKAGVNIIEALTDLRDTVDNPGFRQVIASLLEDIGRGRSSRRPCTATATASTACSWRWCAPASRAASCTEVLDELSENLKWQDEIASQTKKAMIYPTIVLVVIVGVVFVLMTVLVPQLGLHLQAAGAEAAARDRDHDHDLRCPSCAGGTCCWAFRPPPRRWSGRCPHQREPEARRRRAHAAAPGDGGSCARRSSSRASPLSSPCSTRPGSA